jgi:hypothetical protein
VTTIGNSRRVVAVLLTCGMLGIAGCGGESGVPTGDATPRATAARTPPQTSRTPGAGGAQPSATTAPAETATAAGASPTTPTSTPSSTASASASSTASATATSSPSATATRTPSATATSSPSATATTPPPTSTPQPTTTATTPAPTPTSTPSALATIAPNATTAAPPSSATSSTPWGWIILAVAAIAGAAAGLVALTRRSRRRRAKRRWQAGAIDAYFRAGPIDDLTVREPAGSPDLYRRIADSSATFDALACSGPDLPSTQAAYMVSRALLDLETTLRNGGAPPSPSSPPPESELDELTIDQARYRLNHDLAVLRPLLGDVAPFRDPRDGPSG